MRILLVLLFCLVGCGEGEVSLEYTNVTPMGIKYRVDAGAASLDAGRLDYYFASVMNCVGRSYDPNNLLVISTIVGVTESRQGVIIINTINARATTYAVLTHEFIHIIMRTNDHVFQHCSEIE